MTWYLRTETTSVYLRLVFMRTCVPLILALSIFFFLWKLETITRHYSVAGRILDTTFHVVRSQNGFLCLDISLCPSILLFFKPMSPEPIQWRYSVGLSLFARFRMFLYVWPLYQDSPHMTRQTWRRENRRKETSSGQTKSAFVLYRLLAATTLIIWQRSS